MLRYGGSSAKRIQSRPANRRGERDDAARGKAKPGSFVAAGLGVSPAARRVPAVPPRSLKAREWLRGYADHKGECVETYGKGPAALSPGDMKKYINANNSEFKRRLGFAMSFMCGTFRSAWTVIKHTPDGCDAVAAERSKRRGCFVRALADLRKMLNTKKGKSFIRACDYLDVKHVCERSGKDAENHVRAWLQWIEETKGLTKILMTLANCTSRLFLFSTWTLEVQACAGDLNTWAVGFPTDKNIVACMCREVRAWLRKPSSKKLLIAALTACAKEHVIAAGAAKTDWADYGAADEECDASSGSAHEPSDDETPVASPGSARDAQSSQRSSVSADRSGASSAVATTDDDADDSQPSDRPSSISERSADRRDSDKRKRKTRPSASKAACSRDVKRSSTNRDRGRLETPRQRADKSSAAVAPRVNADASVRRRSKSRPAPRKRARHGEPGVSAAEPRSSRKSALSTRAVAGTTAPRPTDADEEPTARARRSTGQSTPPPSPPLQNSRRAASPAGATPQPRRASAAAKRRGGDDSDLESSLPPPRAATDVSAHDAAPLDPSSPGAWAPASISEAKALLQSARVKMAGDLFTLPEFEILIQSIPAPVRAAAGIDVKTSNRARLPRNLSVVMERIATVIQEATSSTAPATSPAPSAQSPADAPAVEEQLNAQPDD